MKTSSTFLSDFTTAYILILSRLKVCFGKTAARTNDFYVLNIQHPKGRDLQNVLFYNPFNFCDAVKEDTRNIFLELEQVIIFWWKINKTRPVVYK